MDKRINGKCEHAKENWAKLEQKYGHLVQKIKETLLQNIAARKSRKEFEPLLQDLLELKISFKGKTFSFKKEIAFQQIENFFDDAIYPMLQAAEKNYKGVPMIIQGWFYPFQIRGGKSVLEPMLMTPKITEKVSMEKLDKQLMEINNRVVKTIISPASKKPVKLEEDQDVLIVSKIDDYSFDQGTEEDEKEPATEAVLTRPLGTAAKGAFDITALGEEEPGFLDSPINYSHKKWRLWPSNGAIPRIKRAFALNGITTPRDLLQKLGQNNPTYKEWIHFMVILNYDLANTNYVIGETSASYLLDWMRLHKLIPAEFRRD